MRKQKIFLALFSLFILLSYASAVYAASPGTNATLEFVENFTSGIGDQLLGVMRLPFMQQVQALMLLSNLSKISRLALATNYSVTLGLYSLRWLLCLWLSVLAK